MRSHVPNIVWPLSSDVTLTYWGQGRYKGLLSIKNDHLIGRKRYSMVYIRKWLR